MSRSADNLVMAMMLDIWPRNAAVVDYGVTEANIGAYKDAVRSGKLTADELHAHIYDSAWLTEAIGAPVDTKLDILLTLKDDDEDEEDNKEGDDEEERIERQALAHLDAKADYPDSDYSRPDPEDEIDPVNYYDDGNNDDFPDFSQMSEEQILAWITR